MIVMDHLVSNTSCQPSAIHVEHTIVALHLKNDPYKPPDQVLYLISFLRSEDPSNSAVATSLLGRAQQFKMSTQNKQ
jgi:hypothetical protein